MPIQGLAFGGDGQVLAVGGIDRVIRLGDPTSLVTHPPGPALPEVSGPRPPAVGEPLT